MQVLPMYIPALQLGFSGLLSTAYLRHNFWLSVGYCCKPEDLAEALLAEVFVVIRQLTMRKKCSSAVYSGQHSHS